MERKLERRQISKSIADYLIVSQYSSTSLVRGFWDEIFWPSKPRTTEGPRTGEGLRKVDILTKFQLQRVILWP